MTVTIDTKRMASNSTKELASHSCPAGSIKKPRYTFTTISGIGTLPFTTFRQPEINENGQVAFEGFLSPQAPPAAIFASDGKATTAIVTSLSSDLDITFAASINSSGVVSLTGNQFGPSPEAPLASSALFIGTGKDLIPLADRHTSVQGFGNFQFFGGSAINDANTVAFLGISDRFQFGIFTISNGKITTVATSQDGFTSFEKQIPTLGGDGPFTRYTLPAFNNAGTVAFTAGLNNGDRGVFAGGSCAVRTVVDSKGIFDQFSSPSINDSNTIAFLAQLDDGSSGIYTSDAYGKVNTIASSTGDFREFFSDPSINNAGKVAFQASLDNGRVGIYTGSNAVKDKVIEVGDRLGSSWVSQLRFTGRDAFNSAGQLAFEATLADGTQGIFRADPLKGYS